MSDFLICGGTPLEGSIQIHGAKNAALPILAASVLHQGVSVLENMPDLKDIETMLRILKELGTEVKTEENHKGRAVFVDTSGMTKPRVPSHLVKEVRSSIFLIGPILATLGQVDIEFPGGCEIGKRPIDLHLKGLRALGAEITEEDGLIHAAAKELIGTEILLDYPSVGATENIMMAAVKAKGTTVIRNAAREPEIVDLERYLHRMGAKISGAGTDTVTIQGTAFLRKHVKHTIMADRIVAGTMLAAGAITGGEVMVKGAEEETLLPVLKCLTQAGCQIKTENEGLFLSAKNRILRKIPHLVTLPYPGFPTDMQPQICTFLSLCQGRSTVEETIFENRFEYSKELNKMGANIKIRENTAVIEGVEALRGARVKAKDLRGGAALVLAGLAAEGMTTVEEIKHIERGYERLERMLKNLGANIERVGRITERSGNE